MKTSSTPHPLRLIAFFVIAAAFVRVLFSYFPALSNFSPVAAMALFGGYYFRDRKVAFSFTMLIMFLSDLSLEIAFRLGFREFPGLHPAMPYVYAGFFGVVFLGTVLKNPKPFTLIAASLASSLLFFAVSNFGVWATGGYPQTWEGLTACYVAAIPFLRFTILGDLFFTGVMFGSFEWLKSRYLKPAAA